MESLRFRYHGEVRHVDNVTHENGTLIGMEIRKHGRFSWKIKRFRVDQIEGELEEVAPMRTEEQYAQLAGSERSTS